MDDQLFNLVVKRGHSGKDIKSEQKQEDSHSGKHIGKYLSGSGRHGFDGNVFQQQNESSHEQKNPDDGGLKKIPSKAFEKGFKQATGTWGKELPSISSRTYDAVMEKFDKWAEEAKKTTEVKDPTESQI